MQDGWIKTAAPSRSEEDHDRASLTVSPLAEPPIPRTAEDSDEGEHGQPDRGSCAGDVHADGTPPTGRTGSFEFEAQGW
jgi:hypothetical protein